MNTREKVLPPQEPSFSLLSSGCFFDYWLSGQLMAPTVTSSLLPRPVAADITARCVEAPQLLVALDYDGTLVPIAPRPDEARPTAAVLQLLSRLVRTPRVSVAIVSGRTLANLRMLLPIPGVAYIGTHGLEVCTANGEVTALLPPGAFSTILRQLRKRAEQLVAGVSGVFVEDKGQAFAVHYRLAQPEAAEQVVKWFLVAVRSYQAKGAAIEVLQGNKVVEVHPLGVNKGKAITWLLQSCDQTTLPVYFGDDATDESAFQVLNRRGVTILVADPPRQTSAQYYLRNPVEVWQFLTHLVETQRRGNW